VLETIIKNDLEKNWRSLLKKLAFNPEKLTFDFEKLETCLDKADATKIIRNNIITGLIKLADENTALKIRR